ncbi:MAG: hypothetical protein IKF80_08385 [Erysipelotrichaceae bacterium]|nr:hypothetical protein [Erysipelotrichaceae bacterium]
MKKLFTLLLTLVIALALVGCQKKQIVVMVNLSDGDAASGMQAEMNENSNLKDLFDSFAAGGDFTYELDANGNVATINGKASDDAGNWVITLNDQAVEGDITKIVLNNNDVCDIKYVPAQTGSGLLGGWQVADIARVELTDEEADIFTKAMEKVLGVDYEAVCVLATQVVSGTNYAFLARGTVVSNDPVSKFYIIKVYNDLQGNASAENIAEIDALDLKTTEEAAENLLGGWEIKGTGKPGSLGSEEAQTSFEKATSEVLGVIYNPVQLLASQVVNGTNYIALARGRVTDANATEGLYFVTWYADLEGNSKVSDIQKMDLTAYLG